MEAIFTLTGKVIKGSGRGKKLGFPTANVAIEDSVPEGVYAGEVIFSGRKLKAAVFVGSPKTFGETDYKLEAYIFDLNEDIYGENLSIFLYKKFRVSKKFKTPDKLVEQISRDISEIRRFFDE